MPHSQSAGTETSWSSSNWLASLAGQLDSIDWSRLLRSRHTLYCRLLRNRPTLIYPSGLWQQEPAAFNWLRSCAMTNKLQLREASTDADSAHRASGQNARVSALGLDMLLKQSDIALPPAGAQQALQNSTSRADLAAIIRTAALVRQYGLCKAGYYNTLLQPGNPQAAEQNQILQIYSGTIVGQSSERLFQCFESRNRQVLHYSVEQTQVVELLIGGGEAETTLTTPVTSLVGDQIELEIFHQTDKPVLGVLRATYCRPLPPGTAPLAANNGTGRATRAAELAHH